MSGWWRGRSGGQDGRGTVLSPDRDGPPQTALPRHRKDSPHDRRPIYWEERTCAIFSGRSRFDLLPLLTNWGDTGVVRWTMKLIVIRC